jgi:glycosyltransferase involved in cell wall biosynthesis
MKVLHIQKVAGMGGSERHLLELLAGLSRAGVDPFLVVLSAPGSVPFLDALRERGLGFEAVQAGRDINASLLFRLRRIVEREQPSLIHTHLIHADVYGQAMARLAGIRSVSSVHSTSWFYPRTPYREIARVVLRSADLVVAISNFVRDFLVSCRLARSDRIRVVPYGIDSDVWSGADDERRVARARFDVGPGDFVVGVAARLIQGKGHEIALAAVREVMHRLPIRLLIAGEGPMLDELRARPCLPCRVGSSPWIHG